MLLLPIILAFKIVSPKPVSKFKLLKLPLFKRNFPDPQSIFVLSVTNKLLIFVVPLPKSRFNLFVSNLSILIEPEVISI